MTVLPLSFVPIRRIPPFSLFGLKNGAFSSWRHRRDLDVHHLQSSARLDQDTLEMYTSGVTDITP